MKRKPATKKNAIDTHAPAFQWGDPPPINRAGRPSKYGLEKMEQGQFVTVPLRALNSMLSWGKRHGRKFVSRRNPDNPEMRDVYWPKSE